MSTSSANISRETLTPVVRRVLGSDSAEVLRWSVEALSGVVVETTESVRLVAGMARDGDEIKPWSVVLKRSRMVKDESQNAHVRRELGAYESGVLDNLPVGIRAPRCFGVERQSGGSFLLWLEAVTDICGGDWPLERYALAARHLGRLNAAYLVGRPLPTHDWLDRDMMRRYLSWRAADIARYEAVRDDPIARRVWPEGTAERWLRLYQDGDRFAAALDRLPQTFCHNDAFKRNLLASRRADGTEETVALDWADAGIGPVGQDLGPFVAESALFCLEDLSDLPELEAEAFESYLLGLADLGWKGDRRLVRFGFAATASLHYGRACLPALALDESSHGWITRLFGRDIEDVWPRWAAVQCYLYDLADEARELLPLARWLTATE